MARNQATIDLDWDLQCMQFLPTKDNAVDGEILCVGGKQITLILDNPNMGHRQ